MSGDLEILMAHLCGKPTGIEVKGVTKTFGELKVLNGANLEVKAGEMMVVIGRSGSGKTTLLRQICGLEEPDEGEVLINSLPPSEAGATVSLVFQSSALFNSMTVAENVELYLRERVFMKNEREITALSRAALSVVGISGREDALPSQLSGGMKRRVAIARALLTNPDVLLFDEPTTGLDPATKKAVSDLIVAIRENIGITQMIVTHDIQLAFTLAERLSIMHGGRVIETGTVEQVSASEDPLVRSFFEAEREEEL
ncbi:MAG: ABC transporter ATP-binding protein [Thermodesulfobacteriota bacterium]